MGVILNGILGGVSGKVGPIIGGNWKGINYIKQYTIPANPRTPDQQAQRSRFAAVVLLAQALYSLIVVSYWNVFAVKMSGFNYFIKNNIKVLEDTTYHVTIDNVISKGPLESEEPVTSVLLAEVVTITWDKETIGNGADTDSIDLVVVNDETYEVFGNVDTLTRVDETGDVNVTGETDATKLIGWIVPKKGSGSAYTIGDSSSMQVTT